jgi:RNase P subunit RPR2
MERIHFLAEASHVAASDPQLLDLAQYLGSEAVLTAKKSQIRAKPRHTFCKKCKTPLVAPFTASVDFSPKWLNITCQLCKTRQKVSTRSRPPPSEIQHWRFTHEVRGRNLFTTEDQ